MDRAYTIHRGGKMYKKNLVGKPNRHRPLGIPMHRW